MQKNNPIICAIDTHDQQHAINLIKQIKDLVSIFKLGLEFFIANGYEGVKAISALDVKIFLDLKLSDIPNTVARAAKILKDLEIEMLSIHMLSGISAIQAVCDELSDTDIKILGVTILTSLNDQDLFLMGIKNKASQQVLRLAKLAEENNVHGIICSAHELPNIRKYCKPDLITVVPGIRLSHLNAHDQKRVVTPKKALEDDANYIVIGRPITQSEDPRRILSTILKNIGCIY